MPMTSGEGIRHNFAKPQEPMLSRLRRSVWTKGAIAKLRTSQIEQLTDEDLVEIVGQMNAYLPQRIDRKRLEFSDRDTLERIVYLARRCCRNQGY